MALTNCPNCKNRVSDKAHKCPKCGENLLKTDECYNTPAKTEFNNNSVSNSNRRLWIALLCAVIIIGGVIAGFMHHIYKYKIEQNLLIDRLAKDSIELHRLNKIRIQLMNSNDSLSKCIATLTHEYTYGSKRLIGKTFVGGGNGGGLGIEMKIEFKEDNKCICTSDWYRAYSINDQLTVKGVYNIEDNKVTVKCNFMTFVFTLSGDELFFDNGSWTPEFGSSRNDYMFLNLQSS